MRVPAARRYDMRLILSYPPAIPVRAVRFGLDPLL